MLSDVDSITPCIIDRGQPTAFKAVLLALGILLNAAAIAACLTAVIGWVQAAYFPTNTGPKAEFRSDLVRDSEESRAAIAMRAPVATTYLLASPFARGNNLFFLPEPMGSEARRQDEASGLDRAERTSSDLVVGVLSPVNAAADEHTIEVALPRSRPFIYKDMQAKSDTADSAGVATTPETLAAASPTAPSASFTFWKKLIHFFQARDDVKLPPEVDAHTAVYDIKAHVVYLPDGEKLEAHSGMGQLQDDIRYVSEKGRGPTPPNTYHLALRKSLFHGVQAIRLTPIDGSKMYGRDGILAHPYMLGPEGQSNGCVSVEDYPKFLEAFLSGKIDRLIVVPKVGDGDTASYAANAPAPDDKRYASQ